MDAAAAGKKPSAAGADVNDMKAILESIQSVEECGSMEEMPQQMPVEPEEKMSMNVTLNARGDAVEDLIKLMGGAGATGAKEVGHDDMPIMKKLPVPADMDKMAMAMAMDDEEVDEAEGEWDNSPDEEYRDHEYMTKDLAGGLNKEKKSYKPSAPGDNPMSLEKSIKEQLLAALEEKYANDAQRKAVHASKDEKKKK